MPKMATAPPKARGVIKTIKKPEGFGFLTNVSTGEDHFFHRTAIERSSNISWDELHPDMNVLFRPVDGPKGPRAVDIEVLGD